MARVTDMLDSLGVGEGGGVMYPDGFVDELRLAYTDDNNAASAMIAQHEATIADLESKLQAAYAANWQLTQQISAASTVTEPEVDADADADDEENDPEPSDFFGDDNSEDDN